MTNDLMTDHNQNKTTTHNKQQTNIQKAVKVQKPLDGTAPTFTLQTSQAFFNQFFCKDYPQYQAQSSSTTRHMDISPVAVHPQATARFGRYPQHHQGTHPQGHPPHPGQHPVAPPLGAHPQGHYPPTAHHPHGHGAHATQPHGQYPPPDGPRPHLGQGHHPPHGHGPPGSRGGRPPYPPPHGHTSPYPPHGAPHPGTHPGAHPGAHPNLPPHQQGQPGMPPHGAPHGPYPPPPHGRHPNHHGPTPYAPTNGHHPHQAPPPPHGTGPYAPNQPPPPQGGPNQHGTTSPQQVNRRDVNDGTGDKNGVGKNGGTESTKSGKASEEFVNKVKEIERRIIQHLHQRGYDESHPDYHRYLQKAKELAIQKAGKEREKMLAQQREKAQLQQKGVTRAEYEQYVKYRNEQQQKHEIAEKERRRRLDAQRRAAEEAERRKAAASGSRVSKSSVKGLIVLRGLPGSGKTTLAKKLAQRSKNARICTEDRYHWSGKEDGVGEYKFQPQLVFLAREWCTKEIRECIQSNVDLIILDNHNARISMYEDHIQYAVEHGYRFRIIEFVATASLIDKYRARSYKKFPREVYVKLLKLWEHDPRTELINPTFGPEPKKQNENTNDNIDHPDVAGIKQTDDKNKNDIKTNDDNKKMMN